MKKEIQQPKAKQTMKKMKMLKKNRLTKRISFNITRDMEKY